MLSLWVFTWTWFVDMVEPPHATLCGGYLVTFPECPHFGWLSDNHSNASSVSKQGGSRMFSGIVLWLLHGLDSGSMGWRRGCYSGNCTSAVIVTRKGRINCYPPLLSSGIHPKGLTLRSEDLFLQEWDGWVTMWPISSHELYKQSSMDWAFSQGILSIGYGTDWVHLWVPLYINYVSSWMIYRSRNTTELWWAWTVFLTLFSIMMTSQNGCLVQFLTHPGYMEVEGLLALPHFPDFTPPATSPNDTAWGCPSQTDPVYDNHDMEHPFIVPTRWLKPRPLT